MTCNTFSPDVEASVRGNNKTGRYVAKVKNNTDTDVYMTCSVNGVEEYGSVGSDRFLLRGVAGATTDHLGTLALDDAGADFEIACVKEFSVEPNATVGPIDHRAAVRACSTTYRLYKAPRPTDPESLARTAGPHSSAHRSGRQAIRGPWSRRGDGAPPG